MNKRITAFTAVLGLALIVPQAQAVVLNPGDGPVNLGSGIATPAGVVEATVTRNFNTGGVQGTLTQWVVRHADNTLSFRYQVINTNAGGGEYLVRLSTTSFAGFLTDVDFLYDSSGLASTILSADRYSASTVGFQLRVGPGETTKILNIKTNATTWGGGRTFIQDGGQDTADTFAPAPEPSSLALLCLGVVGLSSSYAWRRRKGVAS